MGPIRHPVLARSAELPMRLSWHSLTLTLPVQNVAQTDPTSRVGMWPVSSERLERAGSYSGKKEVYRKLAAALQKLVRAGENN